MKTQTASLRIYWVLLLISAAHFALAQSRTDDFSSNHLNWWVGENENCVMSIKNGYYEIYSKTDDGILITTSLFVDKSKDYSIEGKFTQIDGKDNNAFGLLWGYEGSNLNYFGVTTNGNYRIYSSGEKAEGMNEWHTTTLVKPMGETNYLRIVKSGRRLTYYLNNQNIFESPVLPWYAPKVGFITYTQMTFRVDDFAFNQDVYINLPKNLTTGLVKENLGPRVNSECDELAPLISADGQTLYFGRENCADNIGGTDDGEDAWYSMKEGDHWGTRMNMGRPINDEKVNNLAAVSADNNSMLFHVGGGFAFRHRTNGSWSEFENTGISFTNEAKNLSATLSPDGRAILFSAKFPTNLYYKSDVEEADLYVCLKRVDGSWSGPINLGGDINTEMDDIGPFMSADGRTMYFSTKGFPGYGDYDIYFSKRLDDSWTKWSPPVNLGPDINTSRFDAYYTIPASGNYAYMSSSKDSYGKSDIIRIKIAEEAKPDPVTLVDGKVLNAKTNLPIAAAIFFENLSTSIEAGEARSDPKSGDYNLILPFGINYGVRAEAPGFFSIHQNLDLTQITGYKEVQKDLYLVPIEVGESISLNNVFFEQGLPVLKPESYPELDRLAQIMIENPEIHIELSGHTDNRGSKDQLLMLSQNRVLAVKDYLVKKDIKANRITGKGYGSSIPIGPNDTEENRQKNRRVEFKITKK